jgi:hypothetical protein
MTAVLSDAGFPDWALDDALSVAWCESNWIPGATNGIHKGLFQLNWDWDSGDTTLFSGWYPWAQREHNYHGRWDNALDNARLAYLIYNRNNGWAHNWANCAPRHDADLH